MRMLKILHYGDGRNASEMALKHVLKNYKHQLSKLLHVRGIAKRGLLEVASNQSEPQRPPPYTGVY